MISQTPKFILILISIFLGYIISNIKFTSFPNGWASHPPAIKTQYTECVSVSVNHVVPWFNFNSKTPLKRTFKVPAGWMPIGAGADNNMILCR